MYEQNGELSVHQLGRVGLVGLTDSHIDAIHGSQIVTAYLQWFIQSGGRFQLSRGVGSEYTPDPSGATSGIIKLDFQGFDTPQTQLSLLVHELGHAAWNGVNAQIQPTVDSLLYTTYCLSREAQAAVFSYEAAKELRAAGFSDVYVLGPGTRDWFGEFQRDDDRFALQAVDGVVGRDFSSKYTIASLALVGELGMTQGGASYAELCADPAARPSAFGLGEIQLSNLLSNDAELFDLLELNFSRDIFSVASRANPALYEWEGQATMDGAMAEAYRIMQRIIDSQVPVDCV